MSAQIHYFSPIVYGTNYVKSPTFDSRMMWVDTTSPQVYYTIIQSRLKKNDYTHSYSKEYVVKQIGRLNGYYEDYEYQYKFDWKNLIRFQTQTTLFKGQDTATNYYVSEEYIQSYFVLDTGSDMVTKYPTLFSTSDGETIIEQADLDYILTLEVGSIWAVDFSNTTADRINYSYPTTIYNNTWFAVGNHYTLSDMDIVIRQYNGGTLLNTQYINALNLGIAVSDKLIFCDYRTTNVNINRRNSSNVETNLAVIYTTKGCHTLTSNVLNTDINQLFYYDRNNYLRGLNIQANQFIEEVSDKQYINIGSRKIVKSSTTQRKLHQHTGFNLTEDEMYDLMKADFVWSIDKTLPAGDIPNTLRWTMDNSTFGSYNGQKLTERNVELIMSQERLNNNFSNQKINYYD